MVIFNFFYMQEEALSIKNLTKTYGDNVAIDSISLTVNRGEFFGFLGPNGAGKTTTIHCIAGIARYKVGTIHLFGVDVVKDYREARRKVGLSPQEFKIDIFAPTWKLLDYMGGYYGMRKAERLSRINELISKLGLEEHRNKEEVSKFLKKYLS